MIKKIFLFDWGDTIMKDFPDETGAMHTWHRVEAMPNAEKMLRGLSQLTDCYIATNAKDSDKKDIIKALQRVNIHKYFKDVFCYREIGFFKPSKEYFDSIIEKINVKKDYLVMVGDNLESDIRGAKDYGIKSVLYDYKDEYKNYHGDRITDLLTIISEVMKVQLGKINMEYLLTGVENKKTILFVHGLGANLSQFEKQHQYFQNRYKTLSISLRGHGNTSSSSELTESDFELCQLGNDIIKLLDTLGINNVHYVGHSMGGDIGYELIKAHPNRISSFTSYGTTAKLKKSGFTIGLMKFTHNLLSRKTIGKLSGTAGVSEYSKTKIVEMMSQSQKTTVLNLIPHLGNFDYLEVIKNSQLKAQIIRGDKDKEINQVIESTIETFKQRGSFKLIDLENTGHFANLDNPDLFNRTLETFLTGFNE